MNVFVLAIPYVYQGKEGWLHPVLLHHRQECILVDCGYEDSFPFLEKAAAEVGISFSQLTGIVLTHADIDHVAGAFPLKAKYPAVPVYTSAAEAAYISGKEKSLRLQQAEDLDACLPDTYKPAARQFQEMLRTVKPVPVDYLLDVNTAWPLAGEVDVIPTPGHTPGHFSLYIKKQKILVAADVVVIEEKGLALANPQFALDLPKAIDSVKKLQDLPIEKLICYHGGVLESGVSEALDSLVTRWEKAG
ncbi:MAG: MBL fold metallo-hydrolase [Bacteroidota bacterium]|nr:MBL fold metallo-hydrolase [Bacteroidota bacterium]